MTRFLNPNAAAGEPRGTRRGRLAGALLCAWLALPGAARAAPPCADMMVDADDLNAILDQTLGSFRSLVDRRAVAIDPAHAACYVRISLTSSALTQSGAGCRLDGCSTVLFDKRSVALRDFDVAGCDVLFDMFGLSRRVPSSYADASARIRQHCGSLDFEIAGVKIDRSGPAPSLRFSFRPAPAAP